MASTIVMNNATRSWSGLRKNILVKLALSFSDLIALNLALFLSAATVQGIWGDLDAFIPPHQIENRFIAQFIMSVLCTGWFWMRLRHYTYRKPFWFELKEIVKTLVVFSLLDLALIAFSKWDFSRMVWVFSWSYALLLLPLMRAGVKSAINRAGQWQKETIIIGSGRNATEAYAALQSEEILGYNVQAFISVEDAPLQQSVNGVPVISANDINWQTIDRDNVQFIVAMEYEQQPERDRWLKFLSKMNCRSVSVIPTLRGVPLYGTDMSFIFSHEVMILRVSNNLAKHSSRFLKRGFDIVVASLLLLFLAPVFALLCYMVKRDGGNAIYGHERVGQDGKKFKCLKFRSMVTNSKEVLENLLATSEEARREWDKDFKLKNDPRITRIGGFLRKTSLDELPQLWNVIRGEMSLVGPRPVIEAELERYAGDVDYYLMAKPGMTGLWQVSGRNDIDYDTRVYFDSWYVKNWALWTDIAILFKTAGVVLRRDGAY
ncbi:undecaprenyl-phosphate galactose phosphotransferase [Pantoea sp. PNA 14-12]|uniref:UDP-phosphate galactose phosphotransferase n=1 Tax=Pantoea stewartii TaxID=66269 RepID=A0AB34VNR8_9GAMM|nr:MULTISPECIES: undecaprenyl-phosphate galactose phosphotransferase WbaP [Pantoea]KGD81232.1 UDP-phosphate galactose phosphotransferase [Pantoea stewartii subsp. indologenes]KTS27752.1 UDP-phosphate galactose phosphotransferase [Pantoea stewartii]KTS74382.1 UDP-phosphate galactose phosphotransferase [Pantoea stewartii]KTT01088.1 UDP-phosphate galactose phosphotransferase [Pantoea stewartii]KTT08605.1 UDP-phosphate galactose phosphotransferase [Pantoea stewartii]